MNREISFSPVKIAHNSAVLSKIALGGIILLAALLAFVNLKAIGIGNEYYAAAVKSMMGSWKNFFFVAAEPGGSVSIDKPPLGLWLQVFSAFLFGFNGPALALPEIISGILSIPLLYLLVKRIYGTGAGLLAAFILALTPVSVAVMRVNMIDSELVFVLLLAAWAFLKAAEGGRLRWLLLGGALVGVGFNFKMLEAFLPVPAFFAAYLLGSAERWGKKIVNLALTTVILLVISFSWAVVVDLTPASQRPFVGSTDRNSEILLSVGFNGLSRLVGTSGPDVGPRGPLRLLMNPLAKDIGWLILAGLVGSLLLAVWFVRSVIRRRHVRSGWLEKLRSLSPLAGTQVGILLWGGWFLTEFVFFSAASYIHGYYLHTLAPPLAAVIAICAWTITQSRVSRRGWVLLASLAVLIFAYQLWIASHYFVPLLAILLVVAVAGIGIVLLALGGWLKNRFSIGAPAARISAGMILLLAFPLAWSSLTAANPRPDTILPSAYNRGHELQEDQWPPVDWRFLDYLQARTNSYEYLVAVPNAVIGAPYVLASGRPVLYLGGFSGTDPVSSPNKLADLVNSGRLKYVWDLGDLLYQQPAISQWLASSCQVVKDVPLPDPQTLGVPGGPVLPDVSGHATAYHQTLYLCGGK